MKRDQFIKKWFGNKDYQYTEENQDLMRDDLEEVISQAFVRYFVPQTELFHLTIGKKYLITYTKDGRQIKDDRGIERIIRPLPSEIEGEDQE
jgi:hypothetical protein